jgi:hypothetical protein
MLFLDLDRLYNHLTRRTGGVVIHLPDATAKRTRLPNRTGKTGHDWLRKMRGYSCSYMAFFLKSSSEHNVP